MIHVDGPHHPFFVRDEIKSWTALRFRVCLHVFDILAPQLPLWVTVQCVLVTICLFDILSDSRFS